SKCSPNPTVRRHPSSWSSGVGEGPQRARLHRVLAYGFGLRVSAFFQPLAFGLRPCCAGCTGHEEEGSLTVRFRTLRQPKRKHCPGSRRVTGGYPTVMVLDDAFANGKAEPRAMCFAVRSERLEQFPIHFGGDALPAVFDLGDDFSWSFQQADADLAAIRH